MHRKLKSPGARTPDAPAIPGHRRDSGRARSGLDPETVFHIIDQKRQQHRDQQIDGRHGGAHSTRTSDETKEDAGGPTDGK